MYFYITIAILASLGAIYIGIYNIINPKSYQLRLDQKHFKHSIIAYRVLYAISSLFIGLCMLGACIIHLISSIEFDNKEVIMYSIYAVLIILYLLITYLIENIYVEKPIKVKNLMK